MTMKNMSKKIKIALISLLVILLGAGGFFFYKSRTKTEKKETKNENSAPDRIYPVKRGQMVIGIVLRGSVNAKVKHKLALQAPFSTKLVKVVDENVKVRKGEVVAEFETADLLLKVEDYKLTIEQTKKDLAIAHAEREVLVSTNKEELRTAKDKVTECLDAYTRYVRLEGPRDRDTQNLAVSDAEKNLDDMETTYKEAKDTYDNSIFADSDAEETAKKNVEKERQKVLAAETKLNSALLEKKLFKRYTYPNKLKDLRNKLAQARLGYEKAKVSTEAKLTQKDNAIYRLEITLRNNERQYQRHSSWIPMMTLTAPVDGIVTYGDPDRIWGNPEVKVGMDGRRKQVIITIPDMSQMIVDVNLPEQYRSKVSVCNEFIITPESLETVKLKGSIITIASLPVHTIPWDKSTPKIYRTVVAFKEKDAKIVSGMSVQVEVVSRILENVISVPVEAVFEEGGQLLVYRKAFSGPEKVPIKIGESSDSAVEILDGLKEGDEVYLYRPFQPQSK